MTPDLRLMASAAASLLAVVLLVAGGFWLGQRLAAADLAECQRTHAQAVAAATEAAHQAEADFRQREQLTAQQQQEAIHAAHQQTQAARADADRVRAALDRLRQQAAAAGGGGAAAHPAAASSGPPAPAAPDLPADMLWRLGQAAGELAAAADAARTAGHACERAYQALTPNAAPKE